MILVLRTDKPEAEIGLYSTQGERSAYQTWQAHRALGLTLHQKVNHLLEDAKLQLSDIKGVVVYQGPGSFTGLRIGISVANAFAYSLGVPVAAANGNDWQAEGVNRLNESAKNVYPVPLYGEPVRITAPKK